MVRNNSEVEQPGIPKVARVDVPIGLTTFSELSILILETGRTLRFTARGVSMEPFVRDGDHLSVTAVAPILIRPGDIVLCTSDPGHTVVHRVVSRKGKPGNLQFLVQGDRSPAPDGWIDEEQVFGKLTALDRGHRHLKMDQPVMQILNKLALWRLRLNLDQFWLTRKAGTALKHVPFFCRFLS